MSAFLGPPLEGDESEANSEEFHDRHRDEKQRRLRYVMDFYRAKEYLMKNERMDSRHRVLEAMKLTAWANFRDYPADEKGRPLTQGDIAALTGLPTQRVSEVYKQLEAERLIRMEGRIAFLIDYPERAQIGEGEANPIPPRTGKEEERIKALAFWSEHDPDSFKRYQKADGKVKKTTQVLLARQNHRRVLENEAVRAYREFRAKQEGPEEPVEKEPVSHPVREARSRPVREIPPDLSGKPDGASLFGSKAAKELASHETHVREAVAKSGLSGLQGNLAKTVRIAAGLLADAAPDQRASVLHHYASDLHQLALRRNNKPKTWGIVKSAMQDAIDAVREQANEQPRGEPAATEKKPPLEEQIRRLEEQLAQFEDDFPNHVSISGMRAELEELRSQQKQTKGPQSEGHAKAQKAGAQ